MSAGSIIEHGPIRHRPARPHREKQRRAGTEKMSGRMKAAIGIAAFLFGAPPVAGAAVVADKDVTAVVNHYTWPQKISAWDQKAPFRCDAYQTYDKKHNQIDVTLVQYGNTHELGKGQELNTLAVTYVERIGKTIVYHTFQDTDQRMKFSVSNNANVFDGEHLAQINIVNPSRIASKFPQVNNDGAHLTTAQENAYYDAFNRQDPKNLGAWSCEPVSTKMFDIPHANRPHPLVGKPDN